MSIKLMTKVWEHAPYRAEKLLVLLALADWANDKGECWPYHWQVAVKARISEGGALKIIQSLIADGVVERVEQATGRGNYNLYRIHPENFSSVTKKKPEEIKGNPETPFTEGDGREKGNGKGNPETPFISGKGNPDESPKLPFSREKGNPDGKPYKENKPSCINPSVTVTHTEAAKPRVSVSRFDDKTRREFTRHLESKKVLHNPDGYYFSSADGRYDELIQEWINSQATKPVEVKPDPDCEFCEGMGLMRVKADGEPVKFDSSEVTRNVASCKCRKREGGNQ